MNLCQLDVKSALLMTCPYLLADVSLADAAMLISQRGIIRKRVDAFSFLNGIYIYFLQSLGIFQDYFMV